MRGGGGRAAVVTMCPMTLRIPSLLLATAAAMWLAGTAGAATNIAVVGDPGVDNANQAAVASMVAGWAPDHVVLLGDNYYASVGGSGTGKFDRSVGKYYCAFMTGVAPGPNCAGGTSPTNRLWPIAGNHEYSDAGIANYLGYFSLPGNERYYDVRTGPVHFFMLDSDEAMRTPADMAAQKAWLAGALAASSAPFRVVAVHHPPYTSSARGPYPSLRWPFREWGADLVLNGHDHYYERLEAGGLPYVVNGVGGQSVTAFPATAVSESRAHYSGSNGAMQITATDTQLTATFLSVDGVTRDAFTIRRSSADAGAADAAGDSTGSAPVAVVLTGSITGRRVLRVSDTRVRVPVKVALSGAAPQGATVRAAVTLRRDGRRVARGMATARVASGAPVPSHLTVQVRLGASAARALVKGQRVTVATAVTVIPAGGRASTTRATRGAVVR